jgi:hypothetical protein
MLGPKPPGGKLNDIERQGLKNLVHRYDTGQQKAPRDGSCC